jgi:hypothetical protein
MVTVKPVLSKLHRELYNTMRTFAVMRGGMNQMAIDAISAYLTTKVLAGALCGAGTPQTP